MTMQKPTIHFRSRHESGNIFVILALVRREMQKQRRITDYNNLRDRVTHSHDYREALAIIRETVNLIDDDGRE
jgi:hypothetical protein